MIGKRPTKFKNHSPLAVPYLTAFAVQGVCFSGHLLSHGHVLPLQPVAIMPPIAAPGPGSSCAVSNVVVDVMPSVSLGKREVFDSPPRSG